ncbi:hypothetical protein I302_103531 [Kwoniella bestiolae CBS 10118]|uniref:Uncharacterized protein n=1 Tax=Kwoniella bestiolae CBS 10118 TaxID=1296100 RepID=A0A1B9G8T1_9TREE|nr:hypothetical protein I302_02232 [Kwoniella bestiolae CBS 10118]OCF27390.1 hypothetical protein I302_02232 [Kwoniella bestiolae CBS 10118]
MSEQEQQQLQRQQSSQNKQQQYDDDEKAPFENTISNGMIKPGQPGDDGDSTNVIRDVALNPLGKRKKMLSEQIGEENLKHVGKKDGKEDNDSGSLKIRIQLDLDVEVHLSARVKGDITIGLL